MGLSIDAEALGSLISHRATSRQGKLPCLGGLDGHVNAGALLVTCYLVRSQQGVDQAHAAIQSGTSYAQGLLCAQFDRAFSLQ
jgi:hypothetical protein